MAWRIAALAGGALGGAALLLIVAGCFTSYESALPELAPADAAVTDSVIAKGCSAVPDALFCEDFNAPLVGWTPRVDPGGALGLIEGALSVTIVPTDASTCRYANYVRFFSIPASRTRLEYDVQRISGGSVFGALLYMSGADAGGKCVYFLRTNDVATSLVVQTLDPPPLTPVIDVPYPLPKDRFVHVAVDVDGTSSPVKVTVALDGQIVIAGAKMPEGCQTGLVTRLDVGVNCAVPTARVEYRIDDVLLTPL